MSHLQNANSPVLMFPEESGGKVIKVGGQWTLHTLAASPGLSQKVKMLGSVKDKQWDISTVERLDSVAAFLLWQAWGEKLPDDLVMRPEQRHLFDYWRDREIPQSNPVMSSFPELIHHWQLLTQGFCRHILAWLTLFGRLLLDFIYYSIPAPHRTKKYRKPSIKPVSAPWGLQR